MSACHLPSALRDARRPLAILSMPAADPSVGNRSIVRQRNRFGDQRRPRLTLDLHLAVEGHPHAALDVLDLEQFLLQPHARSGRHRRGEAHPVGAVIDPARTLPDFMRLMRQAGAAATSVRYPCAMVLPPGISRFARSTSTWIHW